MLPNDDFAAYVYDLDGTLVRLGVAWDDLERDLKKQLEDAGVDPDGLTAWELLDAGYEVGIGMDLEAMIAAAERDGVANSERLPLADDLAAARKPVAVCTLNAEAPARLALEKHGLADHVDVVVGRDTVSERKPHPEPLLTALDALGVEPSRAVFVGDGERDKETAFQAGVAFRFVEDLIVYDA